ncbi:MAG: transcription antitermination factor NusB [Acidobacteria bacterium]|nr:transcription antitermination factor NusB [Acidobacteriota bacterium]
MPSRHRSRQRALQILYQLDMHKQLVYNAIDDFYETLYSAEGVDEAAAAPPRDEFMERLVRGTVDQFERVDASISQHSEHWRLERMPTVDRNLLRLAVFEMMEVGTPPPVVIDEALELARRFSGDESVPFINGVLDAVRRDLAAPPAKASKE